MDQVLKSLFLYLANHHWLNRMARKVGLRLGANRFVAGETLDSAIEVTKQLNQAGFMVTLDHLGEFVRDRLEATQMVDQCIQTLQMIDKNQLKANLSLKLTSLGLDLGYDECLNQMKRVIQTAAQYQLFVRIDMEDYAHLEDTLQIYHQLRTSYTQLGLVIQAYLYRSENDLYQLASQKNNIRIVKGAYKESAKVAFERKQDVDENMKRLIQLQLELDNYAAVATHDKHIIDFTKQLVKEKQIDRDRFEFQMLYGIRPELQKILIQEGYRVRIYVPYGMDWYGYFMRRLAERPANVVFVLKSIFKR